jgi:hypothetical protein
MRSPLLTALFHPLNLTTLAVAVAAGLCAAWWLFPLGLLVWLIMVVGVARDPARYDFGLLLAGGGWRRGHAAVEAEGFALARDHGPLQPSVDPSRGARGSAEWSFRAFQDDLGVTLRAEVEGMGPRESETTPPRRLRATAGLGAAAVLTLGDAVVTVRGLNLGGRVREETWVDSATGNLARGAGREFRLSVLWPLFN